MTCHLACANIILRFIWSMYHIVTCWHSEVQSWQQALAQETEQYMSYIFHRGAKMMWWKINNVFHVHCYHLIIITISISLFLLLTHRMSHCGGRAVKTGEQQWMASGQPPNAFYAMMSNRWAYTTTKQLSRITSIRGHHPKFIFIRSLYQMMLTEISSKITQHARVWPHVVCLWCNESFWHYVWEILNKQIYYMPNNQGVSLLTPS